MKIYNYNKETLEYTTTEQCDKNPLELGKFLIPKYATVVKPLPDKDGYTQLFKTDKWQYIIDNRGTVYNKETSQSLEYYDLGKLPATLTKLKPVNTFCTWMKTKWVEDGEKLAEHALVNVQIENRTVETMNVEINATGTPYMYPTNNTMLTKLNLYVTALTNIKPVEKVKLLVKDFDDNFIEVEHTLPQLKKVVVGIYRHLTVTELTLFSKIDKIDKLKKSPKPTKSKFDNII